ncbi:hypothetical protein [Chryseobacterium caseinilyticum]|uniref:Uncharacterized protein n=1 Tax=Chryseobacterium caseinilyticum TaxID=2771428 RepID=A0ABR8ZH12_9FLAO|nr:hypothetical protein [Chryseobacterium caseinilyticum]MBD8084587.1 hypothetical protein [Chryseobacterium caseinilyticum]
MKKLSVKLQESKFKIYSEENLFGEIIYDENNLEASLLLGNKKLRAEKDSKNNIELKRNNLSLFTLDFDYIWGGAEIVFNGVDTGFDVKGKWFKPGTRLTDENDKDLVIAVKKDDGLEVSVLDENISDELIITTIFYHIYASAGKTRSIIRGGFK